MTEKENREKLLFLLLPVPFLVWLALLFAPCLGGNLLRTLDGFEQALLRPFQIIWCERSLRTILLFLLLYAAFLCAVKGADPNRRRGEEYGSARWSA